MLLLCVGNDSYRCCKLYFICMYKGRCDLFAFNSKSDILCKQSNTNMKVYFKESLLLSTDAVIIICSANVPVDHVEQPCSLLSGLTYWSKPEASRAAARLRLAPVR